jgi:uncharacterized UPF0160 family protein
MQFDFKALADTAPERVRKLVIEANNDCLRLQRQCGWKQQLIIRKTGKEEFSLYFKSGLNNSEPELLMKGELRRIAFLCGLMHTHPNA